ncbi:MAG TPA: hypothetical protein VML19_09990 [Verrucomicrobiae bacterium]|nr:hypothetical protein [Verrucomicrobiae bacterium]
MNQSPVPLGQAHLYGGIRTISALALLSRLRITVRLPTQSMRFLPPIPPLTFFFVAVVVTPNSLLALIGDG